jgi:hypothetical protein
MELSQILIEESKVANIEKSKFIDLAKTAIKNNDEVSMDALFGTLFRQQDLYFISPFREDWEKSGPFIGNIQDKPCLFVFTDAKLAYEFAMATPGFQWEENKAFIMHMPMEECIAVFKELRNRGVFGIRFNEGEHGFFCPLSHLDGILDRVNRLN